MSAQAGTLARIRQYGDRGRGSNNALPVEAHHDSLSANRASHEARLSATVAYLKRRVQEQQDALEKVVYRFLSFRASAG